MSTRLLPVADGRAIRRFLSTAARHHRRELSWTLLLYAMASACGLVGPRLLGSMVQGIQSGTTTAGHVTVLAATIGAFILLQTFLIRYAFRAAGALAATVLADIRERFVDDTLALSQDVVESSDEGDLVTRASGDTDRLRRSAQQAVPSVTEALVYIVLSIGALALVSWLLLLAILVLVPPLALATKWYLGRAYPSYLREAEASAGLTEGLTATIQGAATVEAFGLEADRVRRAELDAEAWYAAVRNRMRIRTVLYTTEEFLFVLPLAPILLLGGYAYTRGWVDLGQVTAATVYTLQMMIPLETLLDWVGTLQMGRASLARILGVSDSGAERALPEHGEISSADLSVRDVRFAYGNGPEVLHGIDLSVRTGERIAIVGQTGSGKSTLARLLSGVYHPGAGSVDISGVALQEMAPHELRKHVVLVTQEQYIFGGSLRENLELSAAYADREPQATEDLALWDALKAVGADEWVTGLPERLDTTVGAGAEELTDAQAQQIALARLLLADPPVLILDEATSQMDPGSARHLERALATVLEGRTVIAIAHRLHTAQDADRIVVMENGRIAEVGSHQVLLDKQGAYARLWSAGADPVPSC
ncbi:MAG TPA: ABC transporter ATP-binding protein [Actinospica sp.]|nr:ABC transporter ATP-binding protein [Actinospica sp.]